MEPEMESCPLTGRPCTIPKSFHIAEIVEGQGRIVRLCYRCANNYFNEEAVRVDAETMVVTATGGDECPECGSTVEDIRKEGRLGCLHCHQHFGPEVLAFLEKGYVEPQPPKPEDVEQLVIQKREGLATYLDYLEAQLAEAVRAERFEDAAKMRDKIKKGDEILDKKESLEARIDAAVAQEAYETAADLKKELVYMLTDFLAGTEQEAEGE
jgi:protein arginine kinase activator